MSKHTPGPWIYARGPSGIATVAWCEDYAIGPDTGRGNPSQANYDDHGDAESDARLIAAAPELLAACRAIDKEWSEFWPEGPDGGKPPGRVFDIGKTTRQIWRGLRAAIAKATGDA